jgi:ribonuclease BN (tRNA processing enzyme)
MTISRRTLLKGAASFGAVALTPSGMRQLLPPPRAGARPSVGSKGAATRLILLGTGGGPRPKRTVSAPAQVILVGDTPYVIDCGDGVARQLTLAGVPLTRLRHVFLTHHHSDHNADYGNLLLLSWASGLATAVDTWGPPPLADMTRLFLEMNRFDIDTRVADEGRVPLAPLLKAHEITQGGVVLEDANVRVTAALVDHPPVKPAFAYRFDTADRSIVISGDTARSESLIRLARGANVLVHEALFAPAVDRLVGTIPNAPTLKEHILASHTTAEDCGRVAEAAGVETLVLSHLVPGEDPLVTEEMWVAAASSTFRGRVILGKDLMEV